VVTVDDEFYGEMEMTLDQKYISNPATTLTQISLIVARYSERTNTVEEIVFTPNMSEMLAGLYMLCDVGSKITLKSQDMADPEDYFIQGIETWMEGMVTFCRMVLKPAKYETYQFWQIGTTGLSELGVSTVLGAEE
jgi:predicted metal-dependent enzyme (double-stranded beta helix superfamily)